jgi:hypothetical protein
MTEQDPLEVSLEDTELLVELCGSDHRPSSW